MLTRSRTRAYGPRRTGSTTVSESASAGTRSVEQSLERLDAAVGTLEDALARRLSDREPHDEMLDQLRALSAERASLSERLEASEAARAEGAESLKRAIARIERLALEED